MRPRLKSGALELIQIHMMLDDSGKRFFFYG